MTPTSESSTPETSRDSAIARVLREPLVHFLALAALLFAAQAVFVGDTREVIIVDAEAQAFLFDQQEQLLLRPLTDEDRQEIVDTFIEEEILVREATKRGFNESSRIRALLLQNMRFFIAGDLPEPSDKELREFFAANPETFESPPTIDLEHLLFEDPAAMQADVVEQLNGGADPSSMGATELAFGRQMRFMDGRRLGQAFGAESARQIMAINDDAWHGPFSSPQGAAHVIRVTGRNAPRMPDFDTARDWVSTSWLAAKSRELMDRELDSMRPNYRIEVLPLGSKPADD